MQKIAMFGGTFNPIHKGHIQTALYFKDKLSLDKVMFIPTSIPPHKEFKSDVPAYVRYDMCKMVTDKYSFFDTLDIEIKRKGKSYTIDTLKELKDIYDVPKFYVIMGADMFLTIEEWKDYEEIFKLSIICAVPRNHDSYDKILKQKEKLSNKVSCVVGDMPLVNMSSSKIREMISNKEIIKGLVPTEVEEYIYQNNLYCE